MNQHAHRQLLLGMASLFIVMAIGRFAYTPILPFMQHAEHMSDQAAGLLATINYLGYLINWCNHSHVLHFQKQGRGCQNLSYPEHPLYYLDGIHDKLHTLVHSTSDCWYY